MRCRRALSNALAPKRALGSRPCAPSWRAGRGPCGWPTRWRASPTRCKRSRHSTPVSIRSAHGRRCAACCCDRRACGRLRRRWHRWCCRAGRPRRISRPGSASRSTSWITSPVPRASTASAPRRHANRMRIRRPITAACSCPSAAAGCASSRPRCRGSRPCSAACSTTSCSRCPATRRRTASCAAATSQRTRPAMRARTS